jgi:DNA-directed RNA polymerase subunit RPC12/RpoP
MDRRLRFEPPQGRSFELNAAPGERWTVGNASNARIILEDAGILPLHCELLARAAAIEIRFNDLDHTGSVNGQVLLRSTFLLPGQALKIGGSTITYGAPADLHHDFIRTERRSAALLSCPAKPGPTSSAKSESAERSAQLFRSARNPALASEERPASEARAESGRFQAPPTPPVVLAENQLACSLCGQAFEPTRQERRLLKLSSAPSKLQCPTCRLKVLVRELGLHERFEVIGPLTPAPTGTAIRVRDYDGRERVLRIIESFLGRDTEGFPLFEKAAGLSIPGASTILEWTEESGRLFIVEDGLPDCPLQSEVEHHGSLPYSVVLSHTKKLLNTLAAAASQQITHMALSPRCLFFLGADFRSQPRLVGFAYRNLAGSTENASTYQGGLDPELLCMAPEVLADPKMASPRADLYSLGCILYFALTGRMPLQAQNIRELVLKANQPFEFPPAHEINPTVPIAFTTVLDRLLAFDPEKRFESANDASQELLKL